MREAAGTGEPEVMRKAAGTGEPEVELEAAAAEESSSSLSAKAASSTKVVQKAAVSEVVVEAGTCVLLSAELRKITTIRCSY